MTMWPGIMLDSLCYLDMKDQFVYDPLISKRQQYLLATQVRVGCICCPDN